VDVVSALKLALDAWNLVVAIHNETTIALEVRFCVVERVYQ
jgi:hypothetical protein